MDKRAASLRGQVLGADTTRLRVGTIQSKWVVSAYCRNASSLLFGGRKSPLCLLLVWDNSRQQWETLRQQEECKRRALAESILLVEVATEVEAEPAAG